MNKEGLFFQKSLVLKDSWCKLYNAAVIVKYWLWTIKKVSESLPIFILKSFLIIAFVCIAPNAFSTIIRIELILLLKHFLALSVASTVFAFTLWTFRNEVIQCLFP